MEAYSELIVFILDRAERASRSVWRGVLLIQPMFNPVPLSLWD